MSDELKDVRLSVIDERIKNVKNVIAVSSGKGGVGKSLVASALSLSLARRGYRVGLFDLDLTSPSTHIILDVGESRPIEDKGIIPPKIHGISYMSITYYSGDRPTPLRGLDFSNALIELMAITRWGDLDFLILDMPPGISDATLDIIRLIKRSKFLIVTTPSKLALETVKKLIKLLSNLHVKIIGIVENMKIRESDFVKLNANKLGIKYLGWIDFDEDLEDALGDVEKFSKTEFFKRVEEIAGELLRTLAFGA
ncbi:MAG: ATP-binding protein [Candidatus Wolframiiraptor sp. EX4484-121]|nr:MAG: ATP-binding protein [Candidatus Wolframiiraptor sp. EX4484-121]